MRRFPIQVRGACLEDLDSIMEIEKQYGTLVGGQSSMATRELMAHRIEQLNQAEYSWFVVAEWEGSAAIAYIILQPTDLTPEQCKSWSHATDDGTLNTTFKPEGKHLFGVSMAKRQGAPHGALEILIHHSLEMKHQLKPLGHFYCCAPIRGFRRAFEKTKISPEKYWRQKKGDGAYFDHMLEEFRLMVGEGPVRLLKDGYPQDSESLGHAVLYVVKDTTLAALAIGSRLFRAGFLAGRAMKESKREREAKNV